MADQQAAFMQLLVQTLSNTFNPDKAQRKAAEDQLGLLRNVEGQFTTLLHVVAAGDQVDRSARQAAAITMKNLIYQHWVEKESNGVKEACIFASDKETIRTNIIQVLSAEKDSSVRDLICESINNIAEHDFPDQWPNLIQQIMEHIQSGDSSRAYNALMALRRVVKKYEFKPKEMRGPLETIIQTTFPTLLQLMQSMTAYQEVGAAEMMKLLCKIYWSSMQFLLPPVMQDPVQFMAWMNVFDTLMKKPLPEASEGTAPLGQPTELDERQEWPWWKLKKWIAHIWTRLFQRFGNAEQTDKAHKEFAKYFSANVAPTLLSTVMDTLALRSQGRHCTDRVVMLCLHYVESALQLAKTYKPLIKPRLNHLLFEVIVPVLKLNDKDLALWSEDPQEFVRIQHDVMMEFMDPRTAATTVLCDLAEHRTKDVLPRVVQYIGTNLQTYMMTAPEAQDHLLKDAVLTVVGSLSATLLTKKEYKKSMESMIMTHVVPEFRSPHGFLRMRASWVVDRYQDIEWTSDVNLVNMTQCVLQGLEDPELPVRVQNAKTLRSVVENEAAKQVVAPVLRKVLECYFQMMNDISAEEIVSALEAIIHNFPEQIAPLSVDLCSQLSGVFMTYATASEDDDDACLAAVQCMDAVNTVLQVVRKMPEMYLQIEVVLIPMIQLLLRDDGEHIDYLENTLDILSYLSFFSPHLTDQMWQFFPMMYVAFDNFACDYIDNFTIPMDNYISRGTDVFLGAGWGPAVCRGMTPLDMVTGMVLKSFENDGQSGVDSTKACKLLLSVFHHCHGRVDHWVPTGVELVMKKLQGGGAIPAGGTMHPCGEEPRLKSALLKVMASALYYNPAIALASLEALGGTQPVFQMWFQEYDNEQSPLTMKLFALGLTAIMNLPAASLPPIVQQTMGMIVKKLVDNLKIGACKKKDEDGESDEEDGEEEEDDEDEEDDEGAASEEDVNDSEAASYMRSLEEMEGSGAWGDYEDEDDDDDDYTSPIDDVNECVFFMQALQAASAREPEAYGAINASFDADQQAGVQKIGAEAQAFIAAAPARAAAAAKAAAAGIH
jgi:hypothetical protein